MKPTFVRNATPEDILEVAYRLREEDRQEVLAATGLDPRLALPLAGQAGGEILAAGLQSNDRAEILFGVDPIPECPLVGVAWVLTTPVIYDYPVEFTVRSREFYDHFHQRYELLTNYMDERNTRHRKWLSWLGFKFIRRVESFGAENRPFIEFASYKPQHNRGP
jgi:hypothetical protein